jgi:phosphoglycerol transferase
MSARLVRGFFAGLLSASLSYIAISLFRFPRDLQAPSTVVFAMVIIGVAGLAGLAPPRTGPARYARRAAALFIIACATLIPFAFSQSAFGTHDLQSLLITLRENRAGEMLTVGLGSFAGRLAEHAAALLVASVAALYLARRMRGGRALLTGAALALIAVNPVTAYLFRLIVPNPAFALIEPRRDILPPVILARPAQKKNLIVIYLESIERTYRDIPATADAFRPLAQLEDQGFSARNIQQLAETGFTAGGLTATQCGVPLYPRGVFHVAVKNRHNTGKEADFSDFLTGVECLGDRLAADGYVASYMNGSALDVFSKGELFEAHGYTRLFGDSEVGALARETRRNIWGLNDEVLFEKASAEIGALVATGRPFVLSMLTISTHGPDAMLDESCQYPVTSDSGLPAAIHCTGTLVSQLVATLKQRGLADTTIVAVMSDHLAMKNTLAPEIDGYTAAGGERRNLFLLLGAGRTGVSTRPATMIDIYPTLLEALGYRLEGGRANMGVSLFAADQNLTERLGLGALNEAVQGNYRLQEYLWDGVAQTERHSAVRRPGQGGG